MTGIVIVTHSRLGDALIEAAEFILDAKLEGVTSVSVNLNENAEKLHKDILGGINEVNQNRGILILTDMFGGTPSNLSYSFLEEGRIEVLTGINLPILIKALNIRDKKDLTDIAKELEEYGKKSISLASGILKGNKRS